MGGPQQIADTLFIELGAEKARKVVRLLDKRLKAIKRDCKWCGGTGIAKADIYSPCGSVHFGKMGLPCTCDERMEGALTKTDACKV